MIKKGILLLVLVTICFAACNPSDDNSTPQDEQMDNNTIIVGQLSTNQGFANDIVSIEGSNFLSQASNITVRLSSSIADIVTVTNERIDFRIPYNLQESSHSVVLIISETNYDLGLFNILPDTKLLAASSNGNIYELGAQSGNTTLIGSTDYSFLSAFTPVNILKHDNTVYFFDTYSPGASTMVKYNLVNNSSESQELIFPSEIIGNEPGIIAFHYDTASNDIVAVVNENVISGSQNTNYIVRINPNTYEVTYTGVSFELININSSLLRNNMLYASSLDESYEMAVINLDTGITETVELSSDYKITQFGDFGDSIYAMRTGVSLLGGITPILINPNTFEITLFPQDNGLNYTLSSLFGNSFINGNSAFSIITSNIFNVGVLEFNTSTNTYNTQGFNSNSIESNLRILDVIN